MNKITKYRVVDNSRSAIETAVGDIVYLCNKYDYDCSNDDSRIFNEEYISVTRDETGDYPLFTIPARDVEIINE